jgi:hypothetical protein
MNSNIEIEFDGELDGELIYLDNKKTISQEEKNLFKRVFLSNINDEDILLNIISEHHLKSEYYFYLDVSEEKKVEKYLVENKYMLYCYHKDKCNYYTNIYLSKYSFSRRGKESSF